MAESTADNTSLEAEDSAKEREFYKYYQSRSYGLESEPLESGPRASPDKALSAFCQLGVLRLNARRAQISFFDRKNQYILAESTRSSSLQDGSVEDSEDALWAGITRIRRDDSICAKTIEIPKEIQDDKDVTAYIIKDMTVDDRVKHKDIVSGRGHARFYASVPISSPEGHAIGAFCVIADQPREGLDPAELSFMKDMATIIMVHLERTRASEANLKSERMLRGLGSFVEGNYAAQDWQIQGRTANMTQGETLQDAEKWSDQQFAAQNHNHSNQEDPNFEPTCSVSDKDITSTKSSEADKLPNTDLVCLPGLADHMTAKQTSNRQQLIIQNDVKSTFSRAANLIRNVIDMDEAIFFDGSVGTFGGLVERQRAREQSPGSDSSGNENGSGSDNDSESEDAPHQKPCEVLGFAGRDRCSLDGHAPVDSSRGMTEGFLRSLLRKYPSGKIFNIEQSTSCDDNEAIPVIARVTRQNSTSSKPSRSERYQVNKLARIFPGIRSLAVVPLYDSSHDKLYAGGIVWTSDPMRILTAELELSYLAAFGNSIMAEVHRLDTKRSDSAKSKFISSVSHELRSPLHGILGSIECLQDTEMDAFQENLVHTVETCGKTLLDTIDHLLDYAKINNFMQKPREKQSGETKNKDRNRKAGRENQISEFALDADVDLSVVIEEVTETVFAGHDFTRLGASDHIKNGGSNSGSNAFAIQKEKSKKADVDEAPSGVHQVLAIVDVDKAPNSHWIFRTQAGAWRRVIMNLFGNALKYTDKGFVRLHLEAVPHPLKGQPGESRVILTVTDSGRGMSQKYMRDQLFTPFAQENALAPGTGLGLSIVKQIVESMGGEIKVQSEKDGGTEITINIVMTHTPMEDAVLEQSIVASTARKTRGLKVGFVGFKADSFEAAPSTSYRNPANDYHHFMTSFHKLCKNWFEMDMHVIDSLDRDDIDIYLTTEDGAGDVQTQLTRQFTERGEQDRQTSLSETPLLVMCRAASRAQQRIQARNYNSESDIAEYIAQPCGPRKLAKALAICLERRAGISSKPTEKAERQDKNAGEPNAGNKDAAAGNAQDDQSKSLVESQYKSEQDNFQKNIKTRVESQQSSEPVEGQALPFRTPKDRDRGSDSAHSRSPPPSTPTRSRQTLPKRTPKATESPGPPQTVLLVDDNPINLQLLVNYMKKNKHSFVTATNGLEAYEAYDNVVVKQDESTIVGSQHESVPEASTTGKDDPSLEKPRSNSRRDSKFDYVLMDVTMPIMDGLESTRKIRALELQHDISPTTIIALTGLNSASDQHEAYSSGVDMFMTKPVSLKELTRLFKTKSQSGALPNSGDLAKAGSLPINDGAYDSSTTGSAGEESNTFSSAS